MRELHERLGDIHDTSRAVAKHMVETAALERTNAHRAAEGRILCDLIEVMTGVDDPIDQAADAICQILHHCDAEGISVEDVVATAILNLNAEILKEMIEEEST